MKGYNTLLGSHYDHYYLDYISFSAEKPAENVFVVDKGTTLFISIYWLHSWNSKTKWLIVSDVGACHSFPGPGVDHIYTFKKTNIEYTIAEWVARLGAPSRRYILVRHVEPRVVERFRNQFP